MKRAGAVALVCLGIVVAAILLLQLERRLERSRTRNLPVTHEFDTAPPETVRTPLERVNSGDLAGRVQDQNGDPVVGASLAWLEAGNDDVNEATLVESRRLTTSGRFGEFHLQSDTKFGFVLSVRHSQFESQEIAVEKPTEPLLVTLRRGKSISGRIVAALGGAGVEGVRIVALGTGASLRCASGAFYPHAGAQIQSTTSGEGGRFEIAGLSDGYYQLEPVGPGIVAIPEGSTLNSLVRSQGGGKSRMAGSNYPRDRSVIVRSGERDVRVQVVPAAVARFRVLDDETGWDIPHAFNDVVPERADPWPRTLTPDAGRIVANGRRFNADYVDARTHVILAVPRIWPFEGRLVAVGSVRAAGFLEAAVRLPMNHLGSGTTGPRDIRLRRTGPLGGARFRLVDAKGRAVRSFAAKAVIHPKNEKPFGMPKFGFGPDGSSPVFAFPVGEYSVKPWSTSGRGTFVAALIRVQEAAVTEVPLTLDLGVLHVDVIDESGRPVEGYGLRIGKSASPTKMTFYKIERGIGIGGYFAVRPGLGESRGHTFPGLAAAPWRVEVYRVGYEPAVAETVVEPGIVQTFKVQIRANSTCRWDAWDRGVTAPFDTVLDVERR